MNGNLYADVQRAYELDLEQIKLLAEAACQASSPGVRYVLLKHLGHEVYEAMFWNCQLAHMEQHHMPPSYPPPYQPPYPPPYPPPYDDPFSVQGQGKGEGEGPKE